MLHQSPPSGSARTSQLHAGADFPPRWDNNRDAHGVLREDLFGPRRGPGESMALTAVVLVVLTVASSVGAALIAAAVAGSTAHDPDPWAGLGVMIVAALIGAATVPIVATLVLHLLRVPRPGTAMLAAILTVVADARGPQIVFGADGVSIMASCLTAIAIAAGWVGALHPAVLRRARRRARR